MTDTGRAVRVAVADDDERLRTMLVGLLDDLGYEVIGAVGDGAAVVEFCASHTPDVVLLDHRMPTMTGTRAAAALHELHPSLPVVILSAYDDEGLQAAAREAGATSYLVKGCTATEISEAIDDAVAGAATV